MFEVNPNMLRTLILFLIISSLSFALIDPPITEVYNHNMAIVPSGILHENVLRYEEAETTVSNPVRFLYVKVLTLTPSVNSSITSKLHPYLIWLAAEDHNRSVGESYDDLECGDWERRREYGDLQVISINASYTLDGLRQVVGNETHYNLANESQLLADNVTYTNPIKVPFERNAWDYLIDLFDDYILGDMINLSGYEETLAYASPYPKNEINLTVRKVEIGAPHLNVTLQGRFAINYTGTYTYEYEDEEGDCNSKTIAEAGTLTLSASDFASYEVQNDYLTLVPYSPAFLGFDTNTSEEAIFYFTMMSNSRLYKYYSLMDNRIATAYYMFNFSVVNDSYGTQFIVANKTDTVGILPEDPMAVNNYSGTHDLLMRISGPVLKGATEFNNMSYNFSNAYQFKDRFLNLTDGNHTAKLRFYTWFGNYTAEYHLFVRSRTVLSVSATAVDNETVAVLCSLTSRYGGVPRQPVILTLGDQSREVYTNVSGNCGAEFHTVYRYGRTAATFKGSEQYIHSSAQGAYVLPESFIAADFLSRNIGLLILLSVLVAFSAMNFLNFISSVGLLAGGATVGHVFGKFYPFAPRGVPEAKKMIRVKKGKELAVSVAMAVATGGAGAAVAGSGSSVLGSVSGVSGSAAAKKKAAGDSAKKKAWELEYEKELEKKKTEEELKKKAKEKAKKDYELKKKRAMIEWEENRIKGAALEGKIVATKPLNGEIKSVMDYEKSEKVTIENTRKKIIPVTPDRLMSKKEELCAFVEGIHEEIKQIRPGCRDSAPNFEIIDDRAFEYYWNSNPGNQTIPGNRVLAFYDGETDRIFLRGSHFTDPMHIKNGTVKEAMAHELGHASGFFLDPQAPFREGNAELTRVEAIDRYFAFSSDLQHPYPIADPYREDVAQCVIVRKAIGETEYNRIVNHFDLAKKEQMMKDAINSRLGKGTYENTITNNSLPDATSRTDALLQRYEEKTQDLRLHTKIQRLRDYGDLI